MEPAQLRAARSLIEQSQEDLAGAALMSIPTLKRLESGKGPNGAEDARARPWPRSKPPVWPLSRRTAAGRA